MRLPFGRGRRFHAANRALLRSGPILQLGGLANSLVSSPERAQQAPRPNRRIVFAARHGIDGLEVLKHRPRRPHRRTSRGFVMRRHNTRQP